MFLKLSRLLAGFLFILTLFSCDDQSGKYEFFFHENGGSEVAGFWIREEDFVLEDMPISNRPGYAFSGWHLDEELTIPLSAEALEQKNEYRVDLYAKWTPADVDVSVQYWRENLDGDYLLFETETIGGLTGTPVTATPKTYIGYEENTTHPDRIPSGTPEEGVTLVLRFYYTLRTFSVTYIPGNGTEPFGNSYLYGETIVFPEEPTKESYVFAGWYTDPNYQNGPFVGPTMTPYALMLYAKWDPITITITYVTNGGTPVAPVTGLAFSYDDYLMETTRTGYVFGGWYEDEALTIEHTFSIRLPGRSMTLYAKWIPEGLDVTVHHYCESTTQDGVYAFKETTTQIGEFGVLYTATPQDYPGYELNPSHPDAVASGTPELGTQLELSLYYIRRTYQVIFEENGGSEVADGTARYFDDLFWLPTSTRSGFLLTWCVDEALQLTVGSIYYKMPDHDLTLYAKWERLEVFVGFITNGGEPISTLYGETASPLVLPVPVYEGHEFAGWYEDEELTIPYVDTGVMPDHNTTLYAKWEPVSVVVTFVTNGADPIEPVNGLSGDSFSPPTPEWTDHTFGGWYIDDDLTMLYESTGVLPNDDLTLYAKWFGAVYMINFDTMGGSYIMPISLPAGAPLELPIPTREGFVFVGWYDASLTTPFTETVMPAEYLMLYAKWAFDS